MRLYYYGIYNNLGGLENYAKTLLTGIKEKDNSLNITIITECEDIAYKNTFDKLGIEIIVIPQKKHIIKYYKSLIKIFSNSEENDVIQLNIMSYRNSILLKAAQNSHLKILVVGHSNGINKGLLSNLLHLYNRYKYRNLGAKIAISKGVSHYMFNDKNVIVIKNTIDYQRFAYNEQGRELIRKGLNVSDNTFLVGQIGRLSKQKNQLFSLSVMKKIINNHQNIKMLFIGSKSNKKILKKILKNKNENIMYLNQTEAINDYYSAFDLIIMPSLFEGDPLSIIECNKNGCPLIISNNITDNGYINFLSLPLRKKIWAKEILKVHNKVSTIKRINNPPIYEHDFCDDYINLYKNI